MNGLNCELQDLNLWELWFRIGLNYELKDLNLYESFGFEFCWAHWTNSCLRYNLKRVDVSQRLQRLYLVS